MTEIEVKIEFEAFKERTAGDKNLMRDLLSCFKKEFIDTRNTLTKLFLANDNVGIANEFHKLKGSIGIFGFSNVSEKICELENMAKSESCSRIIDDTNCLLNAIEGHVEVLEKSI